MCLFVECQFSLLSVGQFVECQCVKCQFVDCQFVECQFECQ